METDILNDILNRTMSNLFTNKKKHLCYLSYDDDDDDFFKDESIFLPQKQIKENAFNPLAIEVKKNLENYTTKKEFICTPELWRTSIGKKKFEESMKRLDLDEKKVKSKTFANMSLDQLSQEKSKVKNELKKYDNDFFEIFKKPPSKTDKEIMKPLYIYYKSLKSAISKKEQNNQQPQNALSDYSNNTTNLSDLSNVSMGPGGDLQKNFHYNHYQGNNYVNSQKKNNAIVNLNIYLQGNHRKANSLNDGKDNANGIVHGGEVKKITKKVLTKNEVMILEKEIEGIKSEQNKLKEKLHSYQADFQKNNNRKVKFLKDIKPVEKEYNKYKKNKARISEIQEMLRDNQNQNQNQNQNKGNE